MYKGAGTNYGYTLSHLKLHIHFITCCNTSRLWNQVFC